MKDEQTEETAVEMTELAELSLNSIAGISSPHTIKLMGKIEGEPVVVLIDSGASHNFLSDVMIKKLSSRSSDRNMYHRERKGIMLERQVGDAGM